MTIQEKLLHIGGQLEENKIYLKNIDIPFYIPCEELNEAYFDLMTNKIKKLSFDYKKQLEKHLQKLEIRKPKKTKKLTDQLTQNQKNELNKHLDKKAFNLITISISKRFNIDVQSAKNFLRESFLLLLMKSDDRENIKIYNCILNLILKICNKYDSLTIAQNEILKINASEITDKIDKIA